MSAPGPEAELGVWPALLLCPPAPTALLQEGHGGGWGLGPLLKPQVVAWGKGKAEIQWKDLPISSVPSSHP